MHAAFPNETQAIGGTFKRKLRDVKSIMGDISLTLYNVTAMKIDGEHNIKCPRRGMQKL